MKRPIRVIATALVLALSQHFYSALAQGSAFIYQGRLNHGAGPAGGSYDFRFRVASDGAGNTYVGGTVFTNAVPVAGGLFTTRLDFGAGVFAGADRWLEIAVKTNGAASYVVLAPLQSVAPAPYATFATTANNLSGTVSAAQLTGTVGVMQLPANTVTNNASGVVLSGSFSGNGVGITNLGTIDLTPLEFEVNGIRALRLEPTPWGEPNVIGGASNLVAAGASGATLGGGFGNTIQANVFYSTLGGGHLNTIQSDASDATLGGGSRNTIQAGSWYATIGGGQHNTIQPNCFHGTIGGGSENTILPDCWYATVPGGYGNSAAQCAFAAGTRAQANHNGAFVWADNTGTDFASTANNQFLIRAAGGVGIGTPNPQGSLHVYSENNPTVVRVQSTGTPGFGRLEFVSNPQGDANEWRPGYIQSTDNGGFVGGLAFFVNGAGATSKFGNNEVMRVVNGAVGIGIAAPVSALQVVGTVTATAFNPSSDRNLKENFTSVDAGEVLEKVAALRISRWNFKGDSPTPHVGPMAQDFHAAFRVGTDERHIATVDADGVALAAIQGLNQKLEQTRAENAELKRELADLKVLVQQLVPTARK